MNNSITTSAQLERAFALLEPKQAIKYYPVRRSARLTFLEHDKQMILFHNNWSTLEALTSGNGNISFNPTTKKRMQVWVSKIRKAYGNLSVDDLNKYEAGQVIETFRVDGYECYLTFEWQMASVADYLYNKMDSANHQVTHVANQLDRGIIHVLANASIYNLK